MPVTSPSSVPRSSSTTIFGGRDPAKHLEAFQIEHDHRLIVTRGGESMARGSRQRGSVRALNAGDFTEQRPAVFVDDHHAILAGDKQAVIWWIGDDVVPAAIPAQSVGLRDAVRRR